jgi:hypothetical protein
MIIIMFNIQQDVLTLFKAVKCSDVNIACTLRNCSIVFGATASSFMRFLDHTQRCTTVVRTSLDEWLARRRELYLTTRNTDDRHPCPCVMRAHNLSRRADAHLRLWPRGHWDRRTWYDMVWYDTIYMILYNLIWYIFNCNWVDTWWQ